MKKQTNKTANQSWPHPRATNEPVGLGTLFIKLSDSKTDLQRKE